MPAAAATRNVPSPARSAPAGEIPLLLAEWISLSESAITALAREDPDGLLEALASRGELMPRVEQALRSMAPDAATLPLQQIVADLREAEARLLGQVGDRHARIRQELELIEQSGAATSAYLQLHDRELGALNITG